MRTLIQKNNDPKFSDRKVGVNSVDRDQTSIAILSAVLIALHNFKTRLFKGLVLIRPIFDLNFRK